MNAPSQAGAVAVGELIGYGRISGDAHVRIKDGLPPGTKLYTTPQPSAAEDGALLRLFRAIVDAGGPETIARHGVERGSDAWAASVRAGMLAIERRLYPERFALDADAAVGAQGEDAVERFKSAHEAGMNAYNQREQAAGRVPRLQDSIDAGIAAGIAAFAAPAAGKGVDDAMVDKLLAGYEPPPLPRCWSGAPVSVTWAEDGETSTREVYTAEQMHAFAVAAIEKAAAALTRQPVAGDGCKTGTVADYPDADLLRRAVRYAARRARRQPAWARIGDVFALGSTYSAQLCRRFGLDPDTGKDAGGHAMKATIGELFRSNRERMGWSLREASANLGTSHVHLWEIENGRHLNVTIKTLRRAQVTYAIPTDKLWKAACNTLAAPAATPTDGGEGM